MVNFQDIKNNKKRTALGVMAIAGGVGIMLGLILGIAASITRSGDFTIAASVFLTFGLILLAAVSTVEACDRYFPSTTLNDPHAFSGTGCRLGSNPN